jgi:hypothetical protein
VRLWLAGPRLFRGMVRPGISFGPEDLRSRKPPPRRQLQSFIYVVRGDHDSVKIGVTKDPASLRSRPDVRPRLTMPF